MEKKINVKCPVCGTELSIEKRANTSAKSRIEALKAAGVDVSNLFAMTGANGGEFVASNKGGNLVILNDNDPIFQYIVTAGDVPNRKLFRRWVMAQMFQMLTEKRYGSKRPMGFTEALHRRGYEYTWKMLIDELYAQNKMEIHADSKAYNERQLFFDNEVAYKMAMHHIDQVGKIIKDKKVKHCKRVPYITLGGENIFLSDIDKKVISPMRQGANCILNSKDAYELLHNVAQFNAIRQKLNWRTPQCPEWIDAFKGAGAYYTLQNMIRFHACSLWDDQGYKLNKEQSLAYLHSKAVEYKGEGWRLLGLLKKALDDNNIDIEAKMASWRNRK